MDHLKTAESQATNPQYDFNSHVQPPVQQCLHCVIEETALSAPLAPALDSWDGQMTYSELDHVSTAFASHLAYLEIGPETIVPLLFEKSIWAVVSLLAVLKAGGAFLMLDPAHPFERNRQIVQRVNAGIIVTSVSLVGKYRNLAATAIPLSHDYMHKIQSNPHYTCETVEPSNAAYIVFTSGSSGTPKGIVTEHWNIVSNVRPMANALQYSPGLRVAQFASYAFAGAIIEILSALTTGCCLCIPSDGERMNAFLDFMNNKRVQSIILPPSFRHLKPSDLPHLYLLTMGSEAIARDNLETWADQVTFLHGYGQSETSTLVCIAQLSAKSDPRDLGHPYSANIWIVDEEDVNQLRDVDQVGEILVEGSPVARGYFDDVQQTSKTFIEAPRWLVEFRNSGIRHVCRTGDLGKLMPDGGLQICGRKDMQIQLRGQRVEVTEVEYYIREILGVEDVIVDVVTPAGGNSAPLLAAFRLIKANKLDEINQSLFALGDPPQHVRDQARKLESDMEARLRAIVPRYMIPTIVIPIAEVPKTASGKISRKALKELTSTLTLSQLIGVEQHDGSSYASFTNTEKALRKLWVVALSIPSSTVMTDSHFFKLGGDSITAIKLVAQARQENISMSTNDIFSFPVLSDMANHLDNTPDAALRNSSSLPTRSIDSEQISMSVVPAAITQRWDDLDELQHVTAFQEQAIKENLNSSRGLLDYHILDIYGSVSTERLIDACNALIHRNSVLRAVFVEHEQEFAQAVLKQSSSLSLIKTHVLNGDAASWTERFINSDLDSVQALNKPITKFHLLERDGLCTRLILRLSHAQYDGYCLPLLWRDISAAYLRPEGLTQEPLPYHQYVGEARVLRKEENYAYWRELLRDSGPVELVTPQRTTFDKPHNTIISRKIASFAALVASTGFTAATFAKAAWAKTLALTTGVHDVVFEFLSSGRDVAIEGVVTVMGPCINEIPVRVVFDYSSSVKSTLRAIQDQHTMGILHSIVGSKGIWERCIDWPKGSRYSTFLQYQNQDDVRSFRLADDVHCEWTTWGRTSDLQDLKILFTPTPDGQQDVTIYVSNEVIPEQVAEHVMKVLLDTVTHLAKHLDGSIMFEHGEKPIFMGNE